MSKHTPEPWRAASSGSSMRENYSQTHCVTGLGDWPSTLIAGCFGDTKGGEEMAEANANRIAACVNACVGIPTEKLELDYRQGYDPWSHAQHLEQELKRLRASIESALKLPGEQP